MPKKLIIDKDVFRGTSTQQLCRFVKNHFLILPAVLIYECATDRNDPHHKLLKRFREVILAGGYICGEVEHIIRWEASKLQPYGFLADLSGTSELRDKLQKYKNISASPVIENLLNQCLDSAQILLNLAQNISDKIVSEIPEVDKKIRGPLECNKLNRLKIWLERVDSSDIHAYAVRLLCPNLTKPPNRFCLSGDWVSWHYFRIVSVLAFEYSFLKKGKGKNTELIGAEHDINDIKYVVLLSRADALLTRDTKLVKPLAQSMFPKKDVFPSLDDVPCEYVCHWS